MSARKVGYSLLLSAAAVGFLATSWFLVVPQLQQLMSLRHDTSVLDASFEQAKAAGVTRLDQDKLTQLRADTAALLPSEDAQYDLIIQLEALGRTLNIPYQTLTVTPVVTPYVNSPIAQGAAKRLNIALTASLTYEDAQRLLDALPHIERFIHIDHVSLSGGGDLTPGTGQQLSLQVQASAFYLQ